VLTTMMLLVVLGAAGPEPTTKPKAGVVATKPVPRLAVVMKDIVTLQEGIKKIKEDIDRIGPGNEQQPRWRLDVLATNEKRLADLEELSVKAAANEAAAAVAELEADIKRLESELALARKRLAAATAPAKKEF